MGSCADDAATGQSFGEIGIGTCLAGPVALEFFESDGTTWLAVANANPNENFATGSVLVIDWDAIDKSVRRNEIGDLTAYATATDALVADMGLIEREDARLLLVSDRLSEGTITQAEDDRALIIDITNPSTIGPWSEGSEVQLREDPSSIAVDPDAGIAFVANLTDRSISVLDTNASPIVSLDLGAQASVTSSRLFDDDNSGTTAQITSIVHNGELVPDERWTLSWVNGTSRLFFPEGDGLSRWTGGGLTFIESAGDLELDASDAQFSHSTVQDPAISLVNSAELWFSDDQALWSSTLISAGANWSIPSFKLAGGESGAWDAIVSGPSRVDLPEGEAALFFDGRETAEGPGNIGLAVRDTVGNWQPSIAPVVPLGDFVGVSQPWVVADPFTRDFRMWMTADTGTELVIAVSESDDGISWTTPQTVLDAGLSAPTVRYQNGRFRMVGSLQTDGGYVPASTDSIDGVVWTPPVVIALGRITDLPSRTAVQAQTTGGWRMDGESSGTITEIAVAGSPYVPNELFLTRGISLRVSNGHLISANVIDDDVANIEPGSVLTVNGVERLYATAQSLDGEFFTLALEQTGDNWLPIATDLVGAVEEPSIVVVEDGSGYRAFYATAGADGNSSLATATSPDGLSFTEETTEGPPRFPFNQGGIAPHHATPLPGGGWRVWYTASDGSRKRIGAADTPDGVTFTHVPGDGDDFQFGLGNPGDLDDSGVEDPVVVVIDGIEHLWYTGDANASQQEILHAQRTAGSLTWTRDDESIALLFRLGRTFSARAVSNPVVTVDGSNVRVFYSGFDGERQRIGMAKGDATTWFPVQDIPTPGDRIVFNTVAGGADADVIRLNQSIDGFTATGLGVSNLTFDGERGFLYVTQRRNANQQPYVQVFDVRDDSAGAFIDTNAFDLESVLLLDRNIPAAGLRDVLVVPGTDRMYAAAENPDAILAIDLSRVVDDTLKDVVHDALTASIPLLRIGTADPGRPFADEDAGADTGAAIAGAGLALAPDGKTLLVAHFRDNSIVVIDTSLGAWGEEIRRIPNVGENPHKIVISPDGRYAVVANYLGEIDDTRVNSTLAVIDLDPESTQYLEVVTWLVNR
ncbi:MAG: DNA-binding beta-propeller fold protein YncE [Myxococcota bacterium]